MALFNVFDHLHMQCIAIDFRLISFLTVNKKFRLNKCFFVTKSSYLEEEMVPEFPILLWQNCGELSLNF